MKLFIIAAIASLVNGQGSNDCDYRDPRHLDQIRRIRHGAVGRHPNLASIGVDLTHYVGCHYYPRVFDAFCAGVFINSRFVLTSAACAESTAQIRGGGGSVRRHYHKLAYDPPFENYMPDIFIIYAGAISYAPTYNANAPFESDLALIELDANDHAP